MSQNTTTVSQPSPAGTSGQQGATGSPAPRPRGPPLHKIYELPAPIRTFPLPSFYPNNPISIFHVLYAWTKQAFFPPPAEPSVVHEGIWSPKSKSVNVIDEKSMRALWEQGFYGKGNLSRSEPNWLKREMVRRGLVPGQVSEIITVNRREERRQMKWERAKSEQEAIRQTRLQEQQANPEPVVDTLSLSTDVTVDTSVDGLVPESLVEPISLPDSTLAPVDMNAEVEPESTSPVTKDASIITPTEPKSGFVPALDNASAPATNGIINGVTSTQAVLESATIHAFEILPSTQSAPIGPLELLRLPNSHATIATKEHTVAAAVSESDLSTNGTLEAEVLVNGWSSSTHITAPVSPLQLLSLPNAHVPLLNGNHHESDSTVAEAMSPRSQKLSTIHEDASYNSSAKVLTGHLIKDLIDCDKKVNGIEHNGTAKASAATATELPSTPKPLKRRKSVRFSPRVESATYQLSDPPSPSFALLNGKSASPANGTPLGPSVLDKEEKPTPSPNGAAATAPSVEAVATPTEVVNKEHLQLTSEEAFFLSFGLGALKVVDPTTKAAIPTADLLKLFRQYSYFPPRAEDELQPDDSFLVNYAVYHHFRSLGWVPRAGIKFGVDWMLYAKGPVFDHAEFGAIVLPSYSHKWWKESDRQLPRKTWHWLHGVVRVLSHVQKSLVLVYVDVPPPPQFDEALKKGGPAEVFKLYKVREVMVKRWSSNRNR